MVSITTARGPDLAALNGGAGLFACPGGLDLGARTLTITATGSRTLARPWQLNLCRF